MFIPGQEYRRKDIHSEFGGQEQGGISTPSEHPLIFLFSGESGEQYGYDDGWKAEGFFLYSGEGQKGDMEFTRGNRSIRDHEKDGKKLLLFQYSRKGYVQFIDEMKYDGHILEDGPDIDGNTRKIIKFKLKPVNPEVAEDEKELGIPATLFTFLIDKWNGMTTEDFLKSINSNEYYDKFYSHFKLPMNPDEEQGRRYFNPFTKNYVAANTFSHHRQTRLFGCINGIDDRLNCEKTDCDQLKKANPCNKQKGNIWVQEEIGGPVRFAKSYLKTFSTILDKNKAPLSEVLKNFYPDHELNNELLLKFEDDFKLSKEEIETLFEYDLTPRLKNPYPGLLELLEYLKAQGKKCCYLPLLVYIMIKLKDKSIIINEADLVEAFKHFYELRKAKNLILDQEPCNPLPDGTSESTLRVISKTPIPILLGKRYLITKYDFNEVINAELGVHDKVFGALGELQEIIIEYYLDLGDEEPQIEEVMKDWDNYFLNFENEEFDEEFLKIKIFTEFEKILEMKKQVILFGPPGTSKTYFAKEFTKKFVNKKKGNWKIIQFHPSYMYEDFIEGLMARPTKDKASIYYQYEKKIFVNICEEAEKNPNQNYVIIIDEINRGNISKIFGELIYSIEYRDEEITLSSGFKFKVPKNLFIIGTMNSIDRSLAFVDYALRRRFFFFELLPDPEILQYWLEKNLSQVSEAVIQLFSKINQQIKGDDRLGEHYQLGQSYFFTKTKDELKINWNYAIKPILKEYYFNNQNKLKDYQEIFDGIIKNA